MCTHAERPPELQCFCPHIKVDATHKYLIFAKFRNRLLPRLRSPNLSNSSYFFFSSRAGAKIWIETVDLPATITVAFPCCRASWLPALGCTLQLRELLSVKRVCELEISILTSKGRSSNFCTISMLMHCKVSFVKNAIAATFGVVRLSDCTQFSRKVILAKLELFANPMRRTVHAVIIVVLCYWSN